MFNIFKKKIHPQIRYIGNALNITHLQPQKMIDWGNGKIVPEPPEPPMGDGSRFRIERFKIEGYTITLRILYDVCDNIENIPSLLKEYREVSLDKEERTSLGISGQRIELEDHEQKFLRKRIENILNNEQPDNGNRHLLQGAGDDEEIRSY
jgi:hypothetical protein